MESDIPVRWPIPKDNTQHNSGLSRLPLLRVREFRQLLAYLEQNPKNDYDIKDLQKQLPDICGGQSLWTDLGYHLLEVITNNLQIKTYPSHYILAEVKKQLLMARNECVLGQGVFIGTVHSAKGLEFDHVVVLGGDWKKAIRKSNNSVINERRLYYVAMTRAKETLLLVNQNDQPLPYKTEIIKAKIGQYDSLVATSESPVIAYDYLGMTDLVLSYPSWQSQSNLIHQALAQARTQAIVSLRPILRKSKDIGVYDKQNRLVAKLSKSACKKYHQNNWSNLILEARIFALIQRTKNDDRNSKSSQNFKQSQVDYWEIPLIQIKYIQATSN